MTQQQALNILKTGATVFLTGEPGSGKTHTINEYIAYLKAKRIDVAVTASTGIAATHIGGSTIHSWSGIGIKNKITKYDIDRIATREPVVRRIKKTKVLVIDEISMLDSGVLDGIDQICQEIKQDEAAFGGIQVVFVGDFFQLPPVTKDGTEPTFVFESEAWREANPLICYLSEQHRQEDPEFLDILSALRRNAVTPEHRTRLNKRRLSLPQEQEAGITRLFSHNADVDRMNEAHLLSISGSSKTYRMAATGKKALIEQLIRGCISPERLTLKEGAVVMFTKNSPKGLFVNGTLGTCVGFDKEHAFPVIKTNTGRLVDALPMDWTVEDDGRVLARISQIPLRLAWAITVHKSQGMSLDAAHIDLRSAFVAGQGYVALSRVRSLEGLYLQGYNEQALAVHPQVLERDAEFRQLSDEAQVVFTKMSPKKLRVMHDNFIRVAGGTVSKGKTPVRPGKAYTVELLRKKHPSAIRERMKRPGLK